MKVQKFTKKMMLAAAILFAGTATQMQATPLSATIADGECIMSGLMKAPAGMLETNGCQDIDTLWYQTSSSPTGRSYLSLIYTESYAAFAGNTTDSVGSILYSNYGNNKMPDAFTVTRTIAPASSAKIYLRKSSATTHDTDELIVRLVNGADRSDILASAIFSGLTTSNQEFNIDLSGVSAADWSKKLYWEFRYKEDKGNSYGAEPAKCGIYVQKIITTRIKGSVNLSEVPASLDLGTSNDAPARGSIRVTSTKNAAVDFSFVGGDAAQFELSQDALDCNFSGVSTIEVTTKWGATGSLSTTLHIDYGTGTLDVPVTATVGSSHIEGCAHEETMLWTSSNYFTFTPGTSANPYKTSAISYSTATYPMSAAAEAWVYLRYYSSSSYSAPTGSNDQVKIRLKNGADVLKEVVVPASELPVSTSSSASKGFYIDLRDIPYNSYDWSGLKWEFEYLWDNTYTNLKPGADPGTYRAIRVYRDKVVVTPRSILDTDDVPASIELSPLMGMPDQVDFPVSAANADVEFVWESGEHFEVNFAYGGKSFGCGKSGTENVIVSVIEGHEDVEHSDNLFIKLNGNTIKTVPVHSSAASTLDGVACQSIDTIKYRSKTAAIHYVYDPHYKDGAYKERAFVYTGLTANNKKVVPVATDATFYVRRSPSNAKYDNAGDSVQIALVNITSRKEIVGSIQQTVYDTAVYAVEKFKITAAKNVAQECYMDLSGVPGTSWSKYKWLVTYLPAEGNNAAHYNNSNSYYGRIYVDSIYQTRKVDVTVTPTVAPVVLNYMTGDPQPSKAITACTVSTQNMQVFFSWNDPSAETRYKLSKTTMGTCTTYVKPTAITILPTITSAGQYLDTLYVSNEDQSFIFKKIPVTMNVANDGVIPLVISATSLDAFDPKTFDVGTTHDVTVTTNNPAPTKPIQLSISSSYTPKYLHAEGNRLFFDNAGKSISITIIVPRDTVYHDPLLKDFITAIYSEGRMTISGITILPSVLNWFEAPTLDLDSITYGETLAAFDGHFVGGKIGYKNDPSDDSEEPTIYFNPTDDDPLVQASGVFRFTSNTTVPAAGTYNSTTVKYSVTFYPENKNYGNLLLDGELFEIKVGKAIPQVIDTLSTDGYDVEKGIYNTLTSEWEPWRPGDGITTKPLEDYFIHNVPSATLHVTATLADDGSQELATLTDGYLDLPRRGTITVNMHLASSTNFTEWDSTLVFEVWPETMYYYASGATQYWHTVGNWWMDEAHTIAAGSEPNASTYVEIQNDQFVTIITDAECSGIKLNGNAGLTINSVGGLSIGINGIDMKAANFSNPDYISIKVQEDGSHNTGYLKIHPNALMSKDGKATSDMPSATIESWCSATYTDGAEYARWQYLGSPVQYSIALDAFEDKWLYAYNEGAMTDDEAWTALGAYNAVEPFVGYMSTQLSTGGSKIKHEGKLVPTKDTDIDLQWTTGSIDEGLNIIANSWTAPIDMKQFDMEEFTAAHVYPYIYIFNTGSNGDIAENGGGAGTSPGQYIVYPVESGSSLPGDQIIPSLQGFMVYANGQNATLTLDYEALVWNSTLTNNHKPLYAPKKAAGEESGLIQMRVTGNGRADEMFIIEKSKYTKGFDLGSDALKMYGAEVNPQLYAMTIDGAMCVLATDEMKGTQIGLKAGTGSEIIEYTIRMTNVETSEELYLKDNVTGLQTLITEEAEYTFYMEPGAEDANRFQIVGKKQVATGCENLIDAGEMHVYDIQGRKITDESVVMRNGVYIIRQGENVKKVVR